PGNELRVHDTINQLAKTGAEVLHQEIAPVHVSGHACAEELRTLLSLLRPRAVMPVHGEFRMLAAHAQLAREAGVPADAIILAENGTVVELSRDGVRVVGEVETGMAFVDGLGVGDVHDVALRDRRRLSEDGVLIVVATVAASNGGSAGPAGPMASRTTRPNGRLPGGSWANSGRVRRRRSRTAGCSNAGGVATRTRPLRAPARRRCDTLRIAPRPRWRASTTHSTAICS